MDFPTRLKNEKRKPPIRVQLTSNTLLLGKKNLPARKNSGFCCTIVLSIGKDKHCCAKDSTCYSGHIFDNANLFLFLFDFAFIGFFFSNRFAIFNYLQ